MLVSNCIKETVAVQAMTNKLLYLIDTADLQ